MPTTDNDAPSSVLAPPKLQARDWIAGLERGIAVIEAFDEEHPRLTASQVELVWTDIAAKRKVARYLHCPPLVMDAAD